MCTLNIATYNVKNKICINYNKIKKYRYNFGFNK